MANIPEHYISDSKINKMVKKPLSDEELKAILGKSLKIVMYPDLAKYSSIELLLPQPNDYCIILIVELKPNSIYQVTGQLYLNTTVCTSTLTHTETMLM